MYLDTNTGKFIMVEVYAISAVGTEFSRKFLKEIETEELTKVFCYCADIMQVPKPVTFMR